MHPLFKSSLAFLTLLLVTLFLSSAAHADNATLDFTLVNKTGYGIKDIYIAPSSTDSWGDSVLSKVLENNESIDLVFSPKATATEWDLRIEWIDEGKPVEWKKLDLSTIKKLTLHYDRDTDVTSADTE